MTGEILPAALLCISITLALAFATRETRWRALSAMAFVMTGATLLTIPKIWQVYLNFICWFHLVLSSIAVYRANRPLYVWLIHMFCLSAGFWSGVEIAASGHAKNVLWVLPFLLVVLPAVWVLKKWGSLALKVPTSWLLASALLGMALHFVPVTIGNMPDHME